MSNKVSYEEQIEMGLVKRPSSFVAPLRGDVLPPARSVQNISEPYAPYMPQSVQQVVKYESNPLTRAKALTTKAREVTIFLAVLTAGMMYMFQLYPHNWQMVAILVMWITLVSLEWIALFVLLAILDYREQPAALDRMTMKHFLSMMRDEQGHKLRHLYPNQYDEKGRRKWKK